MKARDLKPGDRVVVLLGVRTVASVFINAVTIADEESMFTSTWPGVRVLWTSGATTDFPLDGDVDLEDQS